MLCENCGSRVNVKLQGYWPDEKAYLCVDREECELRADDEEWDDDK